MDVLSSHMSTCTQAPNFHTGCSGKLKPGDKSYKQDITYCEAPSLPEPTCPAHLLKRKVYFIKN